MRLQFNFKPTNSAYRASGVPPVARPRTAAGFWRIRPAINRAATAVAAAAVGWMIISIKSNAAEALAQFAFDVRGKFIDEPESERNDVDRFVRHQRGQIHAEH